MPILGKSGGNTPNTYVQSLSSPGTYPGKNQGALKDSNAESEWWTKDLTLSRAAGTGAYIAFSVPAAVTVGCIQLRMPCTKAQPSMFTGFRAKVGNVPFSAAYTDGKVPMHVHLTRGEGEVGSTRSDVGRGRVGCLLA